MGLIGGSIQSIRESVTGGGSLSELYSDTTDANYGLGKGITFHADAENNISIGENALNSTTGDADYNIGIGTDALTTLTTGDNNIGIGGNAGYSLEGGSHNIFLGRNCGDGIDDEDYNIAIGYSCLGNSSAATVGSIFIGGNAAIGALTTGTNYTVGIGYAALAALTSGEGNIAIGYAAADGLTTGDRNMAIGHSAMTGAGGATVLDSDDNLFIGYSSGAGTWVTAKNNKNVAIGNYTMDAAMNGAIDNVAIGYAAGGAITTSDNNVIIGAYAGDAITTGAGNTALGYLAVSSLETNGGNTGVGYQALKDATGERNTTLGYIAGTAIVGGSNNTIIGYGIDADTTTQNNQTVIGVGGVFKLLSKEYTCDHSDDEEVRASSSESSPLKLPAYSIIKSISVIVKTLSNLGTYNVALYHSTDDEAPADDTALGGTPVEVLGAGASDTCSGNSASAVDINLGSGAVVKQSYYNAFGGAGLPVGTDVRYIHVGQAGTSNGDTDPSTAGVLKVLVEYVGLD